MDRRELGREREREIKCARKGAGCGVWIRTTPFWGLGEGPKLGATTAQFSPV